nr:RNA-directed DNA polymerase, eukaryota, reverse transcriptase zinc-binding domain protein [Tanacetum cinerariifolium]
MWRLKIEQHFQIKDYALWDVIENGNSFKPMAQTVEGSSTPHIPGPVTADEKIHKKNDVKARSMLLMAIPNEHLMTFNQYRDAKSLFDAITTRFGRNDATRKTQKTLLKQMHENFSAQSTDKSDLDKISIDDLYNNFKIIEQEVKKNAGPSLSSGSQNMAFVSTPSTSNNDDVSTVFEVSTASPQVSTTNLSDATVYAFLANHPNGSQLMHEDLEQILEDDLEEMNLKWQLALLSMGAKRFFQKTGKKITINGSDTAGYDKAKVECFNCHKMRHFARECIVPKNQENRTKNQETTRRIVNVEYIYSKALVVINGAGFDWSYMADDEAPTNMAFIAFLDLEYDELRVEFNKSEFNLANYKRGLASVKEQLVHYKKNESLLNENIAVLKNDILIKNFEIAVLKNKLIGSQITDKSKRGLGYASYNDVTPPHTGRFSPPRIDLSCTGLPEFAELSVESYGVKPIEARCKYNQRERMVNGNNHSRVNHSANTVPKAVSTRTGLKPINIVRTVNPKSTRRSFQRRATYNNRNFFQKVNTARPNSAVLNAVRANKGKAVKASACLVWRPIKLDSASIVLKKHTYIDAQGKSKSTNICRRSTTNMVEFDIGQEDDKLMVKDKTITEASVKRHLKLADADGISTLPTTEILEQLALMGYVTDSDKLTFQKGHFSPQWRFLIHAIFHCLSSKKTSWEQFSSNIAIAIIFLATNRMFNFSKLIFDGMVKNLENKYKFLTYPRFLQLILNKDSRLNISHKRLYTAPALTQKVFSNMKRESRGFSKVETTMFPTKLVNKQLSQGEGLTSPVGTQHTPTVIETSSLLQNISNTYRKTKTKTKRMGIRIPQSNVPSSVVDEAITKDMNDGLGRATTTASSFEAKQGSGNISKTQTKATPSGPSSPRTSSEGGPGCHVTIWVVLFSMKLLELMDICTKLSDKAITLENELKGTKARPYHSHQKSKEVKKKLKHKRRRTIVDSLEDEEVNLDKEDSPKRERMIEEINEDENVKLVKSSKQEEAHKIAGHRMKSDDTEVVDFSTVSPQKDDDEITIAETFVNIKKCATKDKEQAQLLMDDEYAQQVQAQWIQADEDLAQRMLEEERESLSIEEKSRLLTEFIDQRKKMLAAKRVEEKRNKPPTQAQQRTYMSTYIKNMGGYTLKQLRNTLLKKPRSGEGSSKEGESLKRPAEEELRQEQQKKQKVKEDLSQERLQQMMVIIPEQGIHVQALQTKLYDWCEVHHISTIDGHDIFMLVEQEYPLSRGALLMMLVQKLQVDEHNKMAEELLRKIFMKAERLRKKRRGKDFAFGMTLKLLQEEKRNLVAMITWCHKSSSKMSKLDRFLIPEVHEEIETFKVATWSWVRDKKSATTKKAQLKGNWIEDPHSVKNAFFSHFKERFDRPCSSRLMLEGEFSNKLRADQSIELESNVTIDEIKRAVWDCGSILVNGSPTGEFQFQKGLKQGDPLSLFLFLLIMESLHLSFQYLVNEGLFKGVSVSSSLHLSHLFYADGVIFMGQWSVSNINTLVQALDCFYKALGLRMNLQKSKLMGISVDDEIVSRAASKMRCCTLTTPFLYLGVKVGGSMSRIKAWDEIEAKLHSRLSKWKMKTLSSRGSGEFSVASTRKFIDNSRLIGSSKKTRWIKMVPIKVNILAWKVQFDLLPTRLNLSRRGVELSEQDYF